MPQRERLSDASSDRETENIDLMWKSPISSKLEKVRLEGGQFFLLKYLNERFDMVLSSWFNFKSKLPVLYELYFGVMYNSELYLSNKFLMISQALEVYHAQKIRSSKLTIEEEQLFVKILPYIENLTGDGSITSKDIDQIKTWLRNGRFPSLRSRIMELYDKYSEIIPYLSIKIESSTCFASKVTTYRNNLTHGNISSDEIDDFDLYWTYTNLQLLLRLCILSELGLSSEEIKDVIRANKLREVIENKKHLANEYLDSDAETAYSWSTEFIDRCELPSSLQNNADLLVDIINGVQNCIEKELKLLETDNESKFHKSISLCDLEPHRKESLLNCIQTAGKEHLELESNQILGISLALWSGCRSAERALLKESQGGPIVHRRELIYWVIERLSHERPIYGKGVEVGLLWMTKTGKGHDVDFEEATHHFAVRKYEKLWKARI